MKVLHYVFAFALLIPGAALAQTEPQSTPPATDNPAAATTTTTPPPQSPFEEGVGPTAFIQLQAGGYSKSIVSSADINLGYNFTDHFGADIGVPLFYVRSPLSLTISSDWKTSTLLGDPYIDVRYKLNRAGVSLTSILTGTGPVSSPERVFTTGRAGVDLFNHIEPAKPIGRITPFLNAGIANSTVNRYYMPRPYSTGRPYQILGVVGDAEAGASVKLPWGLSVGASGYGLFPAGPQKMFSRLVTPGSTVVGQLSFNRYYYSAFETAGSASQFRDTGYSAWVEYNQVPKVVFQVGYTHSVHYHYNMITLSINYDGTALFRTITGKEEQ